VRLVGALFEVALKKKKELKKRPETDCGQRQTAADAQEAVLAAVLTQCSTKRAASSGAQLAEKWNNERGAKSLSLFLGGQLNFLSSQIEKSQSRPPGAELCEHHRTQSCAGPQLGGSQQSPRGPRLGATFLWANQREQ